MANFKINKNVLSQLESQIQEKLDKTAERANKAAAQVSSPAMKARAYAKELQRDGLSVDEKELGRKFHTLARANASHPIEGDTVGITFPAERALRWLIGQPNNQALLLPEEVVPTADQLFVYYELFNIALIQETLDINGSFSFLLTPHGIVEANRLRNTYRYSLAQRRVLDWCKIHPNASPEGILQTPLAQDFTGVLTQQEIMQATDELHDNGYLTVGKASGNFILFARITSAGHQLHRQNMSIDQINSHKGSSTLNISADNYGQQTVGSQTFGGQGHTVNTNLSIDHSSVDINDLLEKFQDIIQNSDASTEDKQDLADDVTRIKKTTSRRGLAWSLEALKLVAGAALPILGSEGASSLMALLPKN